MHDEPTIPLDPALPANLAPTGPDSRATPVPPPVKAASSDEPTEIQKHLPQYRVRELVGRGGMGNVLKVDDPKLARTVALKTMKLGPEATDEQRGRFVREATVLARLAHPNIVPIYDLGADDQGRPFYTMKLVKGRTLKDTLKDIRDGAPEAARQHNLGRLLGVFRKVCDAIAFAHAKGVLHRDLKPENIMVGEFGEVLVMDWGLSKLLHGGQEAWSVSALSPSIVAESRASIGPSTLGATLDGAIMGTPQYMSPEQAEGKTEELDERSDIFSLGAILYAILTLHPPVEGRTVKEVLRKISSGEIAPPSSFGTKNTEQGLKIGELSKLAGLPISKLGLSGGLCEKLDGLSGLPLTWLNINGSKKMRDLSALRGLRLTFLDITSTDVSDLSPLRGMPLTNLTIGVRDWRRTQQTGTNVSDLTPLRGMPLARLALDGSKDPDLTPLAECTKLQYIVLPLKARNVEALRTLTEVRQISWGWPGSDDKMPAAAAFWKDYDAKQKGSAPK